MGESTTYAEPQTFRLGALYRPAPTHIPLLRASLAPVAVPAACRWDETLDLTGEDGSPDPLGNDEVGNCVPCAALRLMQLWTGDGRKPTRNHALSLLRAWGGTPEGGTYTDEAFNLWGARGYQWGQQRQIVPRWTLVERDGLGINLVHIKRAIYALGGVLVVYDLPQSAMQTDLWDVPTPGTPEAASAGYHCVLLCGYDDAAQRFYGPSWGINVPQTYAFVVSRLKQASAFASDAWVRPDGQGGARSPSGMTLDEIQAIGAQVAE